MIFSLWEVLITRQYLCRENRFAHSMARGRKKARITSSDFLAIHLINHPRPPLGIRDDAHIVLAENPVAVFRHDIVHAVANEAWYEKQHPHPAPSRQLRKHREH